MAMDGFTAVSVKAWALAKVMLMRITEALCRLCRVNLAAMSMELVGMVIPLEIREEL